MYTVLEVNSLIPSTERTLASFQIDHKTHIKHYLNRFLIYVEKAAIACSFLWQKQIASVTYNAWRC